MLERLEFHHVGPAPKLEFDFAPRLNLIMGDNGVGKTFILDVAFWALTRSWPGYSAAPHREPGGTPSISFRYSGKSKPVEYKSRYDFQAQTWPSKPGRPPNPGMVLYARVDGSFSIWDPARNHGKKAPSLGVDAPDRPPAYHFRQTNVWDGLKRHGEYVCNGLIRDWAFWQNGGSEPFHQLAQALLALSPFEERLEPGALTQISIDDSRFIPTLKTPYGQEVPVVYASAGIKRIIAIAYLLVWAWQEHIQASRLTRQEVTRQMIFLIDEIEAHLHPRWQCTVLRSILRVMAALTGTEDVEVQVLAVTHSPVVLGHVDRDSIFILKPERDRIAVLKPDASKGLDVNSILADLFDVSERPLEFKEKLDHLHDLIDQGDTEGAKKLHAELAGTLGASEPALVRTEVLLRRREASKK